LKAPLYNADGGRATGVGDGKALAAAAAGAPVPELMAQVFEGCIDRARRDDAARQR
jgi:hypothetical protein